MSSRCGWFVGLATLDVIQRVERLPLRNEKLVAQRSWLAAGGPAAVAAITFAKLGGRAVLWTALGAGAAAAAVRDDLSTAGVEVRDAAPPGFELAVSTAFVDVATGERAVISGSGRTPRFAKIAGPELSGVSVVLIDGHHPPLARSVALAAKGTGVSVVVDAGSAKPVFDEVFPLASDVICSADYVDPARLQPQDLLGAGPELVAVSHGGGDLEWWTATATGRVSPEPVRVLDTLGAGDVLHGAYCFALASGQRRPDALAFAVHTATERVRHLGPFAWRDALSGRVG